ncbi:hypothetical protein VHEMI00829 [[Torrubiella] hemipterigena]|uniref:Uncharacterized protein n=1 Tax=[Torrubiella] hemipterigena TaxID=1531966 RepID=A0A0A1SKE4_9HYPO|nr:hypothetical protein VHEMI00829 [[Torrubiella] hemipterigena]
MVRFGVSAVFAAVLACPAAARILAVNEIPDWAWVRHYEAIEAAHQRYNATGVLHRRDDCNGQECATYTDVHSDEKATAWGDDIVAQGYDPPPVNSWTEIKNNARKGCLDSSCGSAPTCHENFKNTACLTITGDYSGQELGLQMYDALWVVFGHTVKEENALDAIEDVIAAIRQSTTPTNYHMRMNKDHGMSGFLDFAFYEKETSGFNFCDILNPWLEAGSLVPNEAVQGALVPAKILCAFKG